MRGLLIKDIRLLKSQKSFLLAIIVMCVLFLVSSKSYGGVVAYVTFLFAMFGTTTIAYDDFENGMSFLFALPVTKKLYVKEKYVFSIMAIFVGWFGAVVLSTIVMYIKQIPTPINEWLMEVPSYFAVMFLFAMISLPLQLKFGAEKRQMAYLVLAMMVALVLGVLLGVLWLLGKSMGIDLEGFIQTLDQIPVATATGAFIVLCMIVGVISYLVSVKILEKKEY